MTDATTTPTLRLRDEDPRALRAVGILIWGQSVLGAQMPVHIILGGLVGHMLADDPAFATLPITVSVLGCMVTAPGMSWLMGRYGRRLGFLLGALAGALGAFVSMEAIHQQDFMLFLLGSAFVGIYWSAHNFYRFAAADMASDAFRPRAIAWVLGGGLASAILGPEIVQLFGEAHEPVPHAGAYEAVIWLNLAGALPFLLLNIPVPPRRAPTAPRRPLRTLLTAPQVRVAIVCAMVSYGLMNLMMTATPLAMQACGFDTGEAAGVVQLHVLAMYAPSFFVGGLIARFGPQPVIGAGLAMLAAAAAVAATGIELGHFYGALILLGLGWNFGFVGATSMLASAVAPEDRAAVQGLNDFLVMAFVGLASLGSGLLLSFGGWAAVQIAVVPMIVLAAAALLWFTLARPATA
ncbi:MAG: MFS transporter [Pseudomonadota bacterium]